VVYEFSYALEYRRWPLYPRRFPDGLGLPDAATSHQIALAATLTLDKCIIAQSPTTSGIGYTSAPIIHSHSAKISLTWRPVFQLPGAHKGLSVQLKSSGLQIRCTETRQRDETAPPYASYQRVLSTMPWWQQRLVFGPPGQPGVQVGLPERIPSGGQ